MGRVSDIMLAHICTTDGLAIDRAPPRPRRSKAGGGKLLDRRPRFESKIRFNFDINRDQY
jgi:hypothetical protein